MWKTCYLNRFANVRGKVRRTSNFIKFIFPWLSSGLMSRCHILSKPSETRKVMWTYPIFTSWFWGASAASFPRRVWMWVHICVQWPFKMPYLWQSTLFHWWLTMSDWLWAWLNLPYWLIWSNHMVKTGRICTGIYRWGNGNLLVLFNL